MKKEIKFSLVYRDMWQSSGKYQPRADQLAKIAPLIVEMGCFARVETNGGAFEQVNLLYGENPTKAVRTFTKPLREAGIQTHMLDRGLNALRMYPVPADVRRLMYRVKHAQGVDITRIFCGFHHLYSCTYGGLLFLYCRPVNRSGGTRNLFERYGRYRPS